MDEKTFQERVKKLNEVNKIKKRGFILKEKNINKHARTDR